MSGASEKELTMILPYETPKAQVHKQIGSIVIYRTFTGDKYGYAYLTARVDDVIVSDQWGNTVLKVWNYALKRHQRVLASNVITEGALVEVAYEGERIACEVLQIDNRTFEAEDSNGYTKWLLPTRITGVISNAWTHQRVSMVAPMEATA
jgi:hypothetical protein